jgi:hypothetical protein
MKKIFAIVCMLCLGPVLFISGCTEQDNSGANGGTTTGNTYTMTAKEVFADMNTDTDWSTYIKMLYTTLEDGDILIIHDTIDNISYSLETDRTMVIFDASEEGDMSSSLVYPFEGNLTDSYQVEDEVKITATIKYVHETYEQGGSSMDYELEIFEELWTTIDEYIASQGGALPLTTITKV